MVEPSIKKLKCQEVCGIYQGLVNETYGLAQKNKARLSQADQKQHQTATNLFKA